MGSCLATVSDLTKPEDYKTCVKKFQKDVPTEFKVPIRRPVDCDLNLFAQSPFLEDDRENFTHLMFIDNDVEEQVRDGFEKLGLHKNRGGENYNIPTFIKLFANDVRGFKILLKFSSSSAAPNELNSIPEAVYLKEHVKFLKMWYIGHPIRSDEPYISLVESQGNYMSKMVRKSRYRQLIPRLRIIKKKEYMMLVGKDFLLVLYPPPLETFPRHYPEGNGEKPLAMGYYTRMLDSSTETFLEWKAYIFKWHNALKGSPMYTQELLE